MAQNKIKSRKIRSNFRFLRVKTIIPYEKSHPEQSPIVAKRVKNSRLFKHFNETSQHHRQQIQRLALTQETWTKGGITRLVPFITCAKGRSVLR